jgi:uncharacterized protein (DUF2336 family)
MSFVLGLTVLLLVAYATYRRYGHGSTGPAGALASRGAGSPIRSLSIFPLDPVRRPEVLAMSQGMREFGRRNAPTAPKLSEEEVAALLSSATSQEDAALRLGRNVASGSLSFEQLALAEQLLWSLIETATVKVREVIASTLQDSVDLPHAMAKRLIGDVDSVAVPVLKSSPVVQPEDLIEVIRGGGDEKQVAIAQRREVPSTVVDALVDTHNNRAVATLVSNPGAAIDEAVLERVAEKFGADPDVAEMVQRHPRILSHVAAQLRRFGAHSLVDYLTEHPELREPVISRMVLRTLEESAMGLTPDRDGGNGTKELVAYLHRTGRISPLLVQRAICTGEIGLYENAMAALAGIPPDNARALIQDAGALGLASLHEKAGMPLQEHPSLRAAVELLRQALVGRRDFDRARFQRLVVERILADPQHPCRSDADYLLVRLNALASRGGAEAG